eukprot:scaffold20490_cov36-Phaeocystis_antarctica.AAC.1
MAWPSNSLPYHCDLRPVLVSKRTASREPPLRAPSRRRTATSHSPGLRSKSARWLPPAAPYVFTLGVSPERLPCRTLTLNTFGGGGGGEGDGDGGDGGSGGGEGDGDGGEG